MRLIEMVCLFMELSSTTGLVALKMCIRDRSTLSALLNSLSVGFKTLNIQRSADDISKVLASVKTEFQKFGGVLEKTQRQLKHASGNIDDLLNRRTNAIERTLRNIETSENLDIESLLNLEVGEDDGQN